MNHRFIVFISGNFIYTSFYIILLITTLSFENVYPQKNFYGGIFFISNYIASPEFQELKKKTDDINLVDTIYLKALKFFDYDESEALLCLTFACLPYNKIKIRFLFNSILTIPLPSPPLTIFNKKLKNLPRKIFFDSNNDEFGDKDKLSHFFGNAFLGYNSSIFNLSKFIGIFVEIIEQELFIDGSYDNRDILTNYLGELFGKTLKNKKEILPSDVLKVYQLLFLRLF